MTDSWDQRCLRTMLKRFFSPPALEPNAKYSASGTEVMIAKKKLVCFAYALCTCRCLLCT